MKERHLLQDLMAMEPLNPRVAHVLYKMSNVSTRKKLLGQFSTSRSVRDAVGQMNVNVSQTQFQRMIINSDKSVLRFYISRLENGVEKDLATVFLNPKEPGCSTSIANHLRHRTWKRQIVGVTMLPPQEQMHLRRWTDPTIVIGNCITLIINNVKPDAHLRRGCYTPYFGSKTKHGSKKSTLEVIQSDNIIRNLQKLSS